MRRPHDLLATLLASTCTRVPASTTAPRPPRAAGPPESYYEAGGTLPVATRVEALPPRGPATASRVLLPPRVPRALDRVPLAHDPIEILHYRPVTRAQGRQPLILMSPIVGNSLLLVGRFAAGLARAGFHTAIVQRKDLAFHPHDSVARAEDEVRLVVMRSRQALDWLCEQDGVDASRLGTFGISAGAIVSSMVAGADRRLSAHLWMLGGGPLTDVMVHTPEDPFHGYGRAVMRATGMTRSQMRQHLQRHIQTDPVKLAAHVPSASTLLVLARFDRSVPYRYGLALWRALGRPQRIVVPLGHYTTFLLLPWLERRAAEHFVRCWSDGQGSA